MRKSATALILKPCSSSSSSSPFEILLMLRNSKSKSFPNSYVFPGGVRDPIDETIASQFYSQDPHAIDKITAIRETFEESGLLIGHFPQHHLRQKEEWKQWQQEIHQNGSQFLPWIVSNGITLDLKHLFFWNHWMTPKQESRRFDTKFFLYILQNKLPLFVDFDGKELTDLKWISPHHALDQFSKGELFLAPPTFLLLKELRDEFSTLEAVEQACTTKRRDEKIIEPTLVFPTNYKGSIQELFKTEEMKQSNGRDNNSNATEPEIIVALPGDPLNEQEKGTYLNRIEIRQQKYTLLQQPHHSKL